MSDDLRLQAWHTNRGTIAIRPQDITPLFATALGLAGAGAVTLFLTIMPSGPAVPYVAEAPSADSIPIEKPVGLSLPSLSHYAVIAERPLFNRGRLKDVQLPLPSAAPPKPALPPLSDYKLVGLLLSGEMQRALVARGSGDVVTLKPGDNLDGRTVRAIAAKGVSLTGEGHEETLGFLPHTGPGMAMASGSTQANP